VGEYKTAESLGSAGVLNPGKESDKVYAIVGVKGVGRGGSVAIRAGEKNRDIPPGCVCRVPSIIWQRRRSLIKNATITPIHAVR
jgi:hypothetical protein